MKVFKILVTLCVMLALIASIVGCSEKPARERAKDFDRYCNAPCEDRLTNGNGNYLHKFIWHRVCCCTNVGVCKCCGWVTQVPVDVLVTTDSSDSTKTPADSTSQK
jgi:hypothetical protein